jgi:RHS repeat-associated protein
VGPISEHTNARAHCSFQLGTTPEYGTTWLSVASSTDETGTVVQTLDYYPYGGTRINSTSGNYSGAGRQYVNRFADQSSLDYLTNRYYDPSRAQFLTEDPVFWSTKQNLADPQSLNSYSYANDNPITKKDADGLSASTALWPAPGLDDTRLS